MKNGECLKFNQEEVNIIEVDMDQEHFDFAITVAKGSFEMCAAGDDPGVANHIVDRFIDTYGTHWMAIVGENHGCAVNHNGNYAHFHLTKKYADKPKKEKDVVVFKIA